MPTDGKTEVFGRGANDAKGSVACQITAFLDLTKQDILKDGDVHMLHDVGEEREPKIEVVVSSQKLTPGIGYGDGMATFVESLDWTPQYILTGEPTERYQALLHKGSIIIVVDSTGETAHSSVPDLGRNAILQIIDFLPKLLKLDEETPVDDA